MIQQELGRSAGLCRRDFQGEMATSPAVGEERPPLPARTERPRSADRRLVAPRGQFSERLRPRIPHTRVHDMPEWSAETAARAETGKCNHLVVRHGSDHEAPQSCCGRSWPWSALEASGRSWSGTTGAYRGREAPDVWFAHGREARAPFRAGWWAGSSAIGGSGSTRPSPSSPMATVPVRSPRPDRRLSTAR
jgi:hypothetical protein